MQIEWTIRYPFIEAYCHSCRTRFLIEFVTLTSGIKHCGAMTRLPESVYERWVAVKEMKPTGRRMGTTGEPPTATNPCDNLPTAGDDKPREPGRRDLNYNARWF